MLQAMTAPTRGRQPFMLLPLLLVALATSTAMSQDASAGINCGRGWLLPMCQAAPENFKFHDGCNWVTCRGGGEFESTIMDCPEPANQTERRRCDNIREDVQLSIEGSLQISCPMLSMSAVCSTAPRGFTYSDGCNTVVCDGEGSGSSTFVWCPEPKNQGEEKICERRTRRLVARLEPRMCSWSLNNTQVCLTMGEGHRFSDGCNTVSCASDGQWLTTLMACEPASNDSTICQWYRPQIWRSANGGSGGSSGSGGSGGGDEVLLTCPSLSMRNVCTAKTAGFRYFDGCNNVHCMSAGRGSSTMRLCQAASTTEVTRLCNEAQADMERKRAASKLRTGCLTAADVCVVPGERKSFFDGCNYCFCMGVRRAGCTRRACQPYFSTEEEFRAECRRRKAGIIN